jgi:ABC-type nitrate/sulfonate/bicarbonate transport system substrate-binding protein
VKPIVEAEEAPPRETGRRQREESRHGSVALQAASLAATAALTLAAALLLAAPEELAVAVGGPADDPAYLPVHAAAGLGAFEAEGARVRLRRVKHPTAAIGALREGEAAVAVTTTDQAVRGASARGQPVRIMIAHTRVPAVALLVSAKPDRITRIEDLRGQRVGIPGPGTTGHLVLVSLLAAQRIPPWQLELVSLAGAVLGARVASGDLGAAVVEEPWLDRAAGGGAAALIDFRRPEDTMRLLGGPFYEVVSVARADETTLSRLEPALAAFARAVIRVQAWLVATPSAEVAARLPAGLVTDRERFVARLGAMREAYAPLGEATEAGLATTFQVLRGGTPWPVGVKIAPRDLREPPFVARARAQLGPTPAPP